MTEVTEDWLLNESVRIFQPVKGYRAGLDAILLAASLPERDGATALEIGCGAGGALFPAASRLRTTGFTGLERETVMAQLAERGAEANGFADRVRIVNADVRDMPADWENRFDLVFSNPPYFEAERIQTLGEGRSHAYLADVSLRDWLKYMLFATRPKGRITLIHRAGVLSEILGYLHTRTGQIEVFPVHSSPDDPAKRVIVTARKGLRVGEVVLHRGLCMHPEKGESAYTDEAKAVLGGGALTFSKF